MHPIEQQLRVAEDHRKGRAQLVAHGGHEGVLVAGGLQKLLIGRPEGLNQVLDLLLIGLQFGGGGLGLRHVPQHGREPALAGGLPAAERDLHGKFPAILVEGGDHDPFAGQRHGAGLTGARHA